MPAKQVLLKSVLLLAATFGVAGLIFLSINTLGLYHPISAAVINWFSMAWLSLIVKWLGLSLPSKYFLIRDFERSGRLYEKIGIQKVKACLRKGPLHIFAPALHFPTIKSEANLVRLDVLMRQAEATHTWALISMLLVTMYFGINGHLKFVGWLVLFNILINVYPILLQRYNRNKLANLIYKVRETT